MSPKPPNKVSSVNPAVRPPGGIDAQHRAKPPGLMPGSGSINKKPGWIRKAAPHAKAPPVKPAAPLAKAAAVKPTAPTAKAAAVKPAAPTARAAAVKPAATPKPDNIDGPAYFVREGKPGKPRMVYLEDGTLLGSESAHQRELNAPDRVVFFVPKDVRIGHNVQKPDDLVVERHDDSAYFVKAGRVYFADGDLFGDLKNPDVKRELRAHRDRIVIVPKTVRLGTTAHGPMPPPPGNMRWTDKPVMGANGAQKQDAAGQPLSERSTATINVKSFTVRAMNVSEFGMVHVEHSVFDGDGKYIGTWEQRRDLVRSNPAAPLSFIGSRPGDAPPPAPPKISLGHAAPDYLLGTAVDDIHDHGVGLNVVGAILGIVTGPFEVAFHYGYGDEFRSPFGAFFDSVTGRHPHDNGIVYVNVNGIDNNIKQKDAEWLAAHYDVVKDGINGTVKTAVTALVTPFNPKAAPFVGAGVASGFVALGEKLADYDMAPADKKDKLDVVFGVGVSVAKAEAAELVEALVRKLPLSSAVKQRIAGKAAKGVAKIAMNQIGIWTKPPKPPKPGQSPEAAKKADFEARKKASLVIALADTEQMAIDVIAEGVPNSTAKVFFNKYVRDIIKGLSAGFIKFYAKAHH